jgi:hypothetical protein
VSTPTDKPPLNIELKPGRPSTRWMFAAHFLTPIKWEDVSSMGGRNWAEHSLTLYMSPHWRSPQKREVLRFIAKELVETGTEWFSLDGNRWRVDYEKLRAFFNLGTEFEWLTGSGFVEPDYDTTQETTRMRSGLCDAEVETRPLVTLSFERDTLQQSLELDEQRRTRIFDSMRVLDKTSLTLCFDLAVRR